MVFRVETAGNYAVSVRRNRVDRVHDMELFTPRTARPEYSVSEGSIMTPADSPHVLTAGASLHTQPYTDFYFSSQGPTNGPGGTLAGGSVKPDITGYAEVDTVNHGPSRFSGTSAACPHVAGAAALAWSVRPTWSNLEIRAFLGATARDMGPAGKDNRYGMGRLYLGDPIRSMTECPVDVISDEDVFLDDGGSGSLLVSAASGCPWFAASHEQWIHIASGADGNGSGTVTYTVDHNPTTEPRQGRLLVAGTVVPVFQEAARLMPAPRRPSGRRQPGSADVDR
jgi:hypothetical protein